MKCPIAFTLCQDFCVLFGIASFCGFRGANDEFFFFISLLSLSCHCLVFHRRARAARFELNFDVVVLMNEICVGGNCHHLSDHCISPTQRVDFAMIRHLILFLSMATARFSSAFVTPRTFVTKPLRLFASVSGIVYESEDADAPQVRLFTKEGCTLCDKVKVHSGTILSRVV